MRWVCLQARLNTAARSVHRRFRCRVARSYCRPQAIRLSAAASRRRHWTPRAAISTCWASAWPCRRARHLTPRALQVAATCGWVETFKGAIPMSSMPRKPILTATQPSVPTPPSPAREAASLCGRTIKHGATAPSARAVAPWGVTAVLSRCRASTGWLSTPQ